MKESRKWTICPPEVNGDWIDIELYRHPCHTVRLSMDRSDRQLISGVVRTSPDAEADFNDGRDLSEELTSKLWSFVFPGSETLDAV